MTAAELSSFKKALNSTPAFETILHFLKEVFEHLKPLLSLLSIRIKEIFVLGVGSITAILRGTARYSPGGGNPASVFLCLCWGVCCFKYVTGGLVASEGCVEVAGSCVEDRGVWEDGGRAR